MWEFEHGGALSNFRHVVLACQRWQPSCRAHTQPAWDLVSKWELTEPVVRRPPIPEGLLKALCVLAWQLGWHRFVGVLLLAFYGAGRVGEILKCRRTDLLFPQDVLDSGYECIFLSLKKFKSFGRQPAKAQHMKIQEPDAVAILKGIYFRLPADTLIYPASPSAFRRRWDRLLQIAEIPVSCRRTPGGLRGGAAVWLYKNEVEVATILWRLRLRSISTLESYLQALSVLEPIQFGVKLKLKRIGSLIPFLKDAATGLL